MAIITFIQNFLNNNIGVVTFLVGFVAIYLYIKQKTDKKRDSASLILQEIRYAEQQIRNYRNSQPNQYNLADRLLPTNSWNDNIHLFIQSMEENEIDMISSFYAKAKYIDFLILKRSEQKTEPNQTSITPTVISPIQQSQTVQVVGQNAPPQSQPRMMQFSLPVPNNELVTIELLHQISFSIELIYNTSIVDKLKKISKNKWYHLF